MNCDCVSLVRNSQIPAKVIVLKCNRCHAEYVLYPNGQIEYNLSAVSAVTFGRGVKA